MLLKCVGRSMIAGLCLFAGCAGPEKYVGQQLVGDIESACYRSDPICVVKVNGLIVEYSLKADGQGGTNVIGNAMWRGSTVYNRITGSHLDFYYVESRQILAAEVVWITGDLSKSIAFETRFEYDSPLGYVVLGSASYNVTE